MPVSAGTGFEYENWKIRITHAETPPPPTERIATAEDRFRAWERFRIVFNLVLVMGTIPSLSRSISEPRFTKCVLLGAVFANICFCAGPTVEGYARLIGLSRIPIRWRVFLLGLCLALILEQFSLLVLQLPE